MAILRGGIKIFGQDIRLGLPRDRSLDNVNKDPRLQRAPGGNKETTINRFIAQVNQGEGLARPSRYLVVIQPPQKIKEESVDADQGFDIEGNKSGGSLNDLQSNEMKRNVGMMCQQVTMPSRDIATAENTAVWEAQTQQVYRRKLHVRRVHEAIEELGPETGRKSDYFISPE